MATGYDPIQARFNNVMRDFKTKLDDDNLYDEIQNFTSAEAVYEAADKLQAEQGRSGHLRHLSKIGPFLERMNDYSEAVKTFVQWTSVLKQSFDAIINTTAEIGDLLPEFLEVVKIFDRNDQLKELLVLFFQDILDFYLVALQFFSKSRWKYVFEALWPRQRDRIKIVKGQIDRHALLVRKEVRLEHIREEHQARLDASAHFEMSEKASIRQEHEVIRNMISPRFFDDKLNWYHGRVCDGTNQWLKNDSLFQKWLDPNDDTTRSLWLKGIPGSGKTFLAGAAIDEAKRFGRTVFAFLSHTSASSTTALSILHSLIFQLTFNDLDLQAILCQTSRENIASSVAVALSVLSTLLSSLDSAYIVIDGLDEIDRIERAILLDRMIEVSKTCVNVRIMISSRAESDIYARTGSLFSSIQVNVHNTSSIEVFVSKKTCEFLESRQFLEEEKVEIDTLLAPIAKTAKGMFLYAKILLDCIELLPDVDSIRAELRVLPEDLNDAYGRILSRINKLRSTVARQTARQILGWIGCSPAPMTIREIEQALVIKPLHKVTTSPVKASLNLVELCGPIVEVEDGHARFVHFTVKEYLFDKSIAGYIDLSDATLDLTNRCIYYLCNEHLDDWLEHDEIRQHLLLGNYRLHYYAVTYWFELVTKCVALQRSNPPPPSLITALELLASERSVFDFDDFPLSSDQVRRPEIDFFERHSSYITQMLRRVADFNQQLSGSAIHLNNICDWKWPAPLTSLQMSREIHRVLDDMLCPAGKHTKDCSCVTITHHHGSDVFKCGYLDCPSFRQGFSNKKSRNSHENLHVKPWKCNETNCEYAEIGFVSQRMRDVHGNSHRQEQISGTDLSSGLNEEDDIEALLIDLIRLDKVSEVGVLISRVSKPTFEPQYRIMKAAIDQGSIALFEMLSKMPDIQLVSLARKDTCTKLMVCAVKKGNLKALQFLRPQRAQLLNMNTCQDLVQALVVCESVETRQECEAIMLDKDLYNDTVYSNMFEQSVLEVAVGIQVMKATRGSRDAELRLISFWTRLSMMSDFKLKEKVISKELMPATGRLCSILLAKALLKFGARVDGRRSDTYPTALHYVTRRDTEQNARMMEFLLYHGADPEIGPGSISQQKGARGVAKWLSMSWEELVEKVKADRARGYCPREYRLDLDTF